MEERATIFVVDDDPGVSRAMNSVGQLLDLPVASFLSANEFLASYDSSQPGCLVLDIKMPGMTGLELQQRLIDDGMPLPIIMISGNADVRIAVEAMSRGAVTLLEKPCRLDELTTHIRRAIDIDSESRRSLHHRAQTESKLASLTAKEREVLDLVASGKTNKEIAKTLKLSTRAVEDRRSRLMKKLGARSVVELIQLNAI
ncbi:MAG: response regulator transcription factor [Planctomycetaceae bacterium]|nr:response regulator transcription factor [Planctomycetales bacterium]MCB9872869.1 response regulator transcription factor [Planctomycetaceae bacterium]MCB9941509.1 response regulator transcription factor [Planctomycetaceae bacterium]